MPREHQCCCKISRIISLTYGQTGQNERIRGTAKLGEISKKVEESRLKCCGHVLRRDEEYIGKRVMGMEVPGTRRRGRPKRRWLDSIRNDLSERGLSGEDAQDRVKWKETSTTHKWERMRKKNMKGCEGRRCSN